MFDNEAAKAVARWREQGVPERTERRTLPRKEEQTRGHLLLRSI
jgi:hypothetical protein